jgi:uncharacterized protein YndB with AHSA1/START domain
MARSRVVSVSRTIAAPADVLFNLLADPRAHRQFDGSGMVHEPVRAPARLSLGATFAMSMRLKYGYTTTNRVVAFEENRVIAWCHAARFIWRYDLTPTDGGTLVTESFDYGRPWGVLIEPLGWPERNKVAMAATLERLEALVTT